MGDVLKWIGTAASVLIPGAAPIVAAATGLVSAVSSHEAPATTAPAGGPVDQTFLGGGLGAPDISQPLSPDVGIPQPGINLPDLLAIPGDETQLLEAPKLFTPGPGGFYMPAPFFQTGPSGVTITPRAIGLPLPAFTFGAGAAAGAVGGGAMIGTALAVGRALLPAAERVVPKILLGTSVGAAVYELYRRLRGAGHPHKRARRLALAASGVMLRRRRMRVTNLHALNRAIRRVRGFRRKASKVRGLFGARPHSRAPLRRRRVYRRGDLDPFIVEDTADMMDEWEDAGFEPESFPMAAEGAE